MAAGNIGSPMQLLILLAIVLLLFGGKRLRNLGSDLGGAIKGFKNAMANTENANTNHLVKINQDPQALLEGKTDFNKHTENVDS